MGKNSALLRGLGTIEGGLDRIKSVLSGARDNPIYAVPFRGYGSRERLSLRGRVIEREHAPAGTTRNKLQTLRAMVRRYESDEIPHASLLASFGDRRWTLETDDEGYFELVIDAPESVHSPWTEIPIELCAPLVPGQDNPPVRGLVRVPGPNVRRGIVSDIDDTVVKTGATNIARHVRTVLLSDSHRRQPFDGVAALYRALEDGEGAEENPIFYVSSSPWNLYDVLEGFLAHHGIPLGPILLKDFGLDHEKFFKESHLAYKVDRIASIFDTYPDLPFLLIGDTGQKDAWVFEKIAERYPERVLAIYLRDVNGSRSDPEIEQVEERLAARRIEMLRFAQSEELARHARTRGFAR
jgi:phosphatidate phosphatase APP1